MKLTMKNLDNQDAGEIELSDDVFGVAVRRDIQGTTKKPFKQKGGGRARQGSLRSPQFRGGAVIFGPVVRSHAFGLQKKVRRLALKTALSAKQAEGKLIFLETAHVDEAKTKLLGARLAKFGWASVLII